MILSAERVFFCFFLLGSSEIFKVPLRDVQEVHIYDGSSGYGAEGKVSGRTTTSLRVSSPISRQKKCCFEKKRKILWNKLSDIFLKC